MRIEARQQRCTALDPSPCDTWPGGRDSAPRGGRRRPASRRGSVVLDRGLGHAPREVLAETVGIVFGAVLAGLAFIPNLGCSLCSSVRLVSST